MASLTCQHIKISFCCRWPSLRACYALLEMWDGSSLLPLPPATPCSGPASPPPAAGPHPPPPLLRARGGPRRVCLRVIADAGVPRPPCRVRTVHCVRRVVPGRVRACAAWRPVVSDKRARCVRRSPRSPRS